jgi:hypothetical protein
MHTRKHGAKTPPGKTKRSLCGKVMLKWMLEEEGMMTCTGFV